MRKLLSGVFLWFVVYLLDRGLNATPMELEMHDDANPSHRDTDVQRSPNQEETRMRKELPTWLCVVIFLCGLWFITSLLGCQARRVIIPPEPTIVIAPIVHNNLDFLYFAIAERGELEAWFCML